LRLQSSMAASASKHSNYPKVSRLKLISPNSRNSLDNQYHSHKLSCKRPSLSLPPHNVCLWHTNSKSLSSSQTGTIIRSLVVRNFSTSHHPNNNLSPSSLLGMTIYSMSLKNSRPCSPNKLNNQLVSLLWISLLTIIKRQPSLPFSSLKPHNSTTQWTSSMIHHMRHRSSNSSKYL